MTNDLEDTPPWASAVSEDTPPGLRRRNNVKKKGYCINSDEEQSDESDCCPSEDEKEETKSCSLWEPPISSDEPPTLHPDSLEIRTYTNAPSTVSIIFPSLLPLTYVSDNASVASDVSFASTAFDSLTYHRNLREAQVDSDFDRILARMITEWYYTGASVCVTFPSRFETPGLTFRPSSFLLLRKYLCVAWLFRVT